MFKIIAITTDADTAVVEARIAGLVEKKKFYNYAGLEQLTNRISRFAAESILKYSNPYILARHYLFNNPVGLLNLGKYLLTNYPGDRRLEPIGYFAITGGYLSATPAQLQTAEVSSGKASENTRTI